MSLPQADSALQAEELGWGRVRAERGLRALCPVPCAMDRLLGAAVKTWVWWCHKAPASPGTHPCVCESSAEQGAVSAPAQSGQWRESTDVPPLASPQVHNLS